MYAGIRRRALSGLALAPLLTHRAEARSSWRVATGYRADSFHGINLQQFLREVEQKSNQSLHFEFHPQNSLIQLSDMLSAVGTNKAEIGEAIMSGLVKDVPLAGVDSVPFVVRSYADARRLWEIQRPFVERDLRPLGLSVLYAVAWPPQGLYSTKPIVSVEDLRGTRMRTYGDTTVRIAQLVGANPVEVAATDVNTALAEGRIDNMITSATTGVENAVWRHLKFFYEISAWFPKNLVFVSRASLNELSTDRRDLIRRAAKSAEERGWASSEAYAREAGEALRKNGVKVECASPLLTAQIRRLGEKLSLEWIRRVGGDANSIFLPYFTQS